VALQPQLVNQLVWALPRSLAATCRISSISLPPVTKMFQFTGFPPHDLCIQSRVARHYSDGVSPFGYPRINTSVQLPWAFRRYRVLLRQLVPRHSSHTLLSFIYSQLYRVLDASISSHAMQLSKSFFAGHATRRSAARGNDTSANAECQAPCEDFGPMARPARRSSGRNALPAVCAGSLSASSAPAFGRPADSVPTPNESESFRGGLMSLRPPSKGLSRPRSRAA
jgi:hypothetical protein